MGIYLRQEKQDAIMRGDVSNTVVNRLWVYMMQTLGVHFCETKISPFLIRLHAIHAQIMWEEVVDIQRGDDWELKVHLGYALAAGTLLMHLVHSTKLYVRKCCELINAIDMRFLPASGEPPELSEGIRENLTVLSQLIYLENYLFLTCDGPSPQQTARIEKEFRHELKVRRRTYFLTCECAERRVKKVYPILFDICPFTMRTQGILLVRDTTLLLGICASGGESHDLVQSGRTDVLFQRRG